MMRVIGINLNHTDCNSKFMDGGACLLIDGKPLIAVSEERISRKRYDAGFVLSFAYCLKATGLSLADIDVFAVNAGGLDIANVAELLKDNGFDVPPNKIILCPSPGLCHTYASYYMSGFDTALVITLAYDGVGAYIVNGNMFTDITASHHLPDLGVMYKDLTKAIGYASYQDAGKTMALAPYALEKERKEETSVFNNGDIYAPNDEQKSLAFKAQQELQESSLKLCADLLNEYKINNLCLAGGVGLNCVNNFNLINKLPENTNIMIQPASGDTGLCLGAAFYGYYQRNPHIKNTYKIRDVYLGKSYTQSDIEQALAKIKNCTNGIFTITPFTADKVADLLAKDKVVALFIGKSEFGPRALGHRSLIASPNSQKAKAKLDMIKQREYYRPYAPSILAEYATDYFAKVPRELSDFMLVAAQVLPAVKDKIPFVVHIDGTSRIQTVTKETEPIYYDIIDEFRKKRGLPLVLNTSFNRRNEPIVETPTDAVNTFLDTPIDALLLQDVLVIKNAVSI